MRLFVVLVVVGVVVGGGGGFSGLSTAQEVVTLTVTVETPDGDPVADARLTANWSEGSSQATTAANGKAFIDVRRGAEVTIEVEHPDYVRNRPVVVSEAEADDIDIEVHPKASAQLTVRDEQGPVSNVLVTFRKEGQIVVRTTTDANGVVRVGPIESGTYSVVLRKSRYQVTTVELDLEGEETAEATMRRGSVTLTFNVTDDYFSPPRPIEDATIRVADVGSVQTQANGIQQISVPVNTRLTAQVSKAGYRAVEQEIRVGEADRRIRVHLRRVPSLSLAVFSDRVVVGERVLVEVTDEYGQPVEDAAIRDGEAVLATTNEDGQASVAIESAGDHALVAATDELRSEPVTVTGVRAEEPATTTSPRVTNGPGLDGFGVLVGVVGVLLAVVVRRRHRP